MILKGGALYCTTAHTQFQRTSTTRNHDLIRKKRHKALSVHLYTHTHTHAEEDKESEIFNALANALTSPANRPLKEMSSQLPEVCPFD